MNQQPQQLYSLDEIKEIMRLGMLGQNFSLPENSDCGNTLSMKGTIRTKEVCPRCDKKFTFQNEKDGYFCLDCLTVPKKHFIDLYEKGHGRLRIYSDKQGYPLDSYRRATRVLETIRYEIDQHIFDYTKYASSDLKAFRFETKIEAWYQSKLKEVAKGNLAESYTDCIKRYIDKYYLSYFKGLDVREVRTFHVQEFYEKLPSDLSLKYVKNILSALENFFNTLQRLDIINKKPSLPVITLDKKTPKWIDYKTQQKAINSTPEGDKPIIQFLALQGVRPGEGIVLKVKDLNLESGVIIISRTLSKGKVKERVKSKVIKPRLINPELLPMLKEICKDKLPESFVFLNPRTGKPYSKTALARVWNEVKKNIGMDISLYEGTRHSLASIASSNGVPLQSIQDVLGHTSINTTLKYAHTNLQSQKVVFHRKAKIINLRPQRGPRGKIAK